jgi:hypothetical protein
VSTQATSTFDIDSWEAKPYDEHDGVTLTRTQVTKKGFSPPHAAGFQPKRLGASRR